VPVRNLWLASNLEMGLAKIGRKRPLDDHLTQRIHSPGDRSVLRLRVKLPAGARRLKAPVLIKSATWSVQWQDRDLAELVQAGNKADLDHKRFRNARLGPDALPRV
jgi:hypothetical protein